MRKIRNTRFGAGSHRRRRNRRKNVVENYNRDVREEFGSEEAGGETVRSVVWEKNLINAGAENSPKRHLRRRGIAERVAEDEDTRRYRSTDVFAGENEFGLTYDNIHDDEDDDYDYEGYVESLEHIDKDPLDEKKE